ncbi:HesA/MoeB/ThiF family protein [Croceitalea rosinachiae]|uniref:HesA/MoeB/ThiF family protein n=1 Tax=Croceitalea rosinachiae TaxID=3075596 RepID=A0ABU3ACD4_9FLAO|nr:HesA/MoeB/ThiF family protein [Croceitalea sp. F388]MDT0607563.1 HesA/MoeB/ThiF family protein [Croceitalea sp. F388]
MNDDTRYLRQTSLESFGAENQLKLANSKILIIGLGGLGIPVATYLNAMGVGTIGIMDNDIIELHNLQRQVLYSETDLGKQKLSIAFEKLRAQNSNTIVKAFTEFLTKDNALTIIKDFDVVVDATDNFATRYLINDACVILNKPFIYGALHAFEGQISVFNFKNGPTYRCLFPNMPKNNEILNCDENGVLGILPGIIGTLQALEVVKVITEVGEVLSGKLLLFDGLTQTIQKIGFKARVENKTIVELKEDYGFSLCSIENSIEAEDFDELNKRHFVQLVDVRNPDEFEEFHLPNAINVPLPELENSLQSIDFSMPVYFICQSGKRSEIALQSLQKEYSNTSMYSVSGGMGKMALICH